MEDVALLLGVLIGQFIVAVTFAGIGFGSGCIPLLIADHKQQRSLGFGALLICTGAGFQFGVVGALVACVVCTLAIIFLVRPKEGVGDVRV